jgi:transcriptional regulator with XRE-family HTH domain
MDASLSRARLRTSVGPFEPTTSEGAWAVLRSEQSFEGVWIPTRILDGDFSGWLRDAMKARRLSTRALAMRTGLDHTTIYRLAFGGREPSLTTAVALLRVLGTDFRRLERPVRQLENVGYAQALRPVLPAAQDQVSGSPRGQAAIATTSPATLRPIS